MAVYCIGDLHGRHDLFTQLLKKIEFNPCEDKLYLLGDVIDRAYGGIKILDYIMQYPESCLLIRGNHEDYFAFKCADYDVIMGSPAIKHAVASVIDVFSENLFGNIEMSFIKRLSEMNRTAFYSAPTIKRWLKEGDPKKRAKLLDAMVSMAEQINYDSEIFDSVYRILLGFNSSFQTKELVRELLEQTEDRYREIKSYINNLPESYAIVHGGKQFVLTHSLGQVNPDVSRRMTFPQANTKDTIYIYGHTPVAKIHRKIANYHSDFNFDYKQVFSWIDTANNRYYNLDLASNPIVALKLDDMSEYYVGAPTGRKSTWTIPEDIIQDDDKTFLRVQEQRCRRANFRETTIVTFKEGCYEFIIKVSKRTKRIWYTHVSWLDCVYEFVIEDWYDKQPTEEVIQKVREDFEQQKESPEEKKISAILHGKGINT